MRRIALHISVIVFTVLVIGFVWRAANTCLLTESVVSTSTPETALPLDSEGVIQARRVPLSVSVPSPSESQQSDDATETVIEKEHSIVSGRVVVVDSAGREHVDVSGTIAASIWTGQRGSGRRIVVTMGRFEVLTPLDADLCIEQMKLSGRFAFPDHERLKIESNGEVLVRARWAKNVHLHVVDMISGAELTGITVVEGVDDKWLLDGILHPGDYLPSQVLLDGAVSPIDLDQGGRNGFDVKWSPLLFVRAPGYAWGAATVEFRVGGDVTIPLLRGCELRVRLAGNIPDIPDVAVARGFELNDLNPKLRLRESLKADVAKEIGSLELASAGSMERGPTRVSIVPELNGTTVIDGIAPGSYVLALERGLHFGKPQVLAEMAVDLIAGVVHDVTLTMVAPTVTPRVPLAGTVHLSPEWDCGKFDLGFELISAPSASVVDEYEIGLEQLHPVISQLGEFSFDLGLVRPGRYLITAYQFQFQQILDTGDVGTDRARITIGDPADVSLRLLDFETGNSIGSTCIVRWSCKRPVESDGGVFFNMDFDTSSCARTFRAPAGDVELTCDSNSKDIFEFVDSPFVRLLAGRNDIGLRVRRSTTIVIELEENGHPFDPSSGGERQWDICVVSENGESAFPVVRSWNGSALRFAVTGGGRFRIVFPRLDGFEDIAPIDVAVGGGQDAVSKVTIQRRQ